MSYMPTLHSSGRMRQPWRSGTPRCLVRPLRNLSPRCDSRAASAVRMTGRSRAATYRLWRWHALNWASASASWSVPVASSLSSDAGYASGQRRLQRTRTVGKANAQSGDR